MNELRLDQIPAEQLPVLFAVAAGVGMLYCFAGYRLFKLVLGLTGFILAGAVAAVLVGWLSMGNLVAMGIAGFIGGVCGAFALFFLYKTGVFFVGFLGALVVAYNLMGGRPEPWAPLAALGLAAVGGLVAIGLERIVMTLATAAIGAWVTTIAGALLIKGAGFADQLAERELTDQVQWILLGSWAGLSLVGAVVQFATARKKKD